jgi:hypothetical protein
MSKSMGRARGCAQRLYDENVGLFEIGKVAEIIEEFFPSIKTELMSKADVDALEAAMAEVDKLEEEGRCGICARPTPAEKALLEAAEAVIDHVLPRSIAQEELEALRAAVDALKGVGDGLD